MATVKTHDLINCNGLLPVLPSVNESGVYPYNGLLVKFDNNDEKSYRVRKNVQCRFYHPAIAEIPSLGYPDGTRSVHKVTSMKFNGVEYVVGQPEITINYGDLIYTTYPNYTTGNEYGYTNNISNAVVVGSSTAPVVPSNNFNNVYFFIEGLINLYGIRVNITRTPALWWADEEYVRLDNLTFEKYYDDDFEVTIQTTIIDLSNDEEFDVVDRYVFNGETALHEQDGQDITITNPGEGPQYNDSYSFFSYDYDYDTIVEITDCPLPQPFNASLRKDGCPSITTDCDCTKISFSDNSNYSTWLPGHNPEFFTSRTITITKPDGSKYIMATADVAGADEVIQPHYNSNNTFVYNFTSTDEDGIYNIELCTYPDWQADVLYQSFLNTIVLRNGKLYKITNTNTNIDPSSTAGANYWVEYTCDGDCSKTRYCTEENIVVLCISVLKCYKKLVLNAICGLDASPCAKDISGNESLMDAMKFKVTLDAVEFSACEERWDLVKDQVDILKSICCCDG